MPWQSGFTGLAYDPEKVGKELTSVDDLMDPKLKGKFTLLSEMPDTLGLIMLSLGLDPTTVDDGMFDKALAKLEEMAKNVRQFTGNDYSGMLARGDIWACFGWSGDVAQLQADNPKLKFVVPEAGGVIWTDNMLIPKGGDVYTASVFMDYVYRPEGRRADRGVRQLHLAGGGRGGGDEGHRPGDRVEPAHLPAAGRPRPGQGVRPQRLEQRGLQEEVRRGGRGLTPVRR